VSEKAAETVDSPALAATEALPASVPVPVEADAPVKSGPVPAKAAKPVKIPAPVEPEAPPAVAKAAAEEAAREQSKSAAAEGEKPAVSTAPVRAPFYTVHVGSYRTQAAASAEAERIKAKGHDAFVERVDLGRRGTWYRVKVGRFKIRSEAEQLRKKIHKVIVQDSMVVTNRTD
jgi:cell division protein FtsN